MKRFIFSGLFLLIVLVSFAQSPSLTKAYNFFYDKEFVQAKNMIDLCATDAKLSQKANTWLYKGNIYFYLANEEYEKRRESETYIVQYPDASLEAYNAFIKVKEMNKNTEAYGMFSPDEALGKIYPLMLFYGVNLLTANDSKDVLKAQEVIEKAVGCYEMFTPPAFPMNGELYYYCALTYEMSNNFEKASYYYEKAIHDNSTNLNVYLRLIDNYKKQNEPKKVIDVINVGNKNFQNESAFYVAEIDYYYMIGDSATAKKMLQTIPESIYSNADVMVNLANLFINDKNYQKALDLLNKSNKISPNNFVINYNLGVCYYYLSEEKFNLANEENLKGNVQQYQSLQSESQNYLNHAQSCFEFVLKSEPNDLNILKTLKSIYIRQKYPESKYEDINQRIKQLENNK